MDSIHTVSVAFAAGAAESSRLNTAQATRDAYLALRSALVGRFGANSEVLKAIRAVEERPESKKCVTAFEQELRSAGMIADHELVHLAEIVNDVSKLKGIGANHSAASMVSGAIAQGSSTAAGGRGAVAIGGSNVGFVNTGTSSGDFIRLDKTVINNKDAALTETISENSKEVKDLALLLNKHFSKDDLEQLCFELGTDWENLPGETKSAKARALVQFALRHDSLAELRKLVYVARPNLRKQP